MDRNSTFSLGSAGLLRSEAPYSLCFFLRGHLLREFASCLLVCGFLLVWPLSAGAAPLADLKISVARVQLHKSDTDSFKLVILPLAKPTSVSKGEQVRVSQMAASGSQPRRLVVDYFGLLGKGSKNLGLSDKRVKAIRIGDHSDRTRIVIDLKGENPVASTQVTRLGNGDAYRVDFTIGKAKKKDNIEPKPSAQKSATPSPTSAPVVSTPTPEPVVVETPTPRAQEVGEPYRSSPPGPEESENPLPEETPGPVPTPSEEKPEFSAEPPPGRLSQPEKPSEVPDGQSVLSEIGFEKLRDSGASAVFFSITPIPSYTLEQRGEDQYELNIPGARLAQEGLSLPRFSPEGIDGLDLVVARTGESGVVIRIFIESGIRLFPFVADGKLWVKAQR